MPTPWPFFPKSLELALSMLVGLGSILFCPSCPSNGALHLCPQACYPRGPRARIRCIGFESSGSKLKDSFKDATKLESKSNGSSSCPATLRCGSSRRSTSMYCGIVYIRSNRSILQQRTAGIGYTRAIIYCASFQQHGDLLARQPQTITD